MDEPTLSDVIDLIGRLAEQVGDLHTRVQSLADDELGIAQGLNGMMNVLKERQETLEVGLRELVARWN